MEWTHDPRCRKGNGTARCLAMFKESEVPLFLGVMGTPSAGSKSLMVKKSFCFASISAQLLVFRLR